MPSLVAGLVAAVAGWMMDDSLQSLIGQTATLLVSTVASAVIFYYLRAWLRDLRGR